MLSINRVRTGICNRVIAVWRFYLEGFRSMTVGRTLWAIILVKLFVMFAILKLFFFPDILKRDYPDDESRAAAVRGSLIERGTENN